MQKIVLEQKDTVPIHEKKFTKVNTMFLDLLKNPDHQTSPKNSVVSSSLQTIEEEEEEEEETLPDFIIVKSTKSQAQMTTPPDKTIIVKRLAEISARKTQSLPPPPSGLKKLTKREETDRRTELTFQYEIMRKLYPDAKIPPINKSISLKELENEYTAISRKIEMATTIDKSKKVFVIGLLGIELLLGKLGLDMAGFTLDQLNAMENYNDVLYELGKKYTMISDAKLEPEIKLIGLLLFSVLAHIVTRTLETSGSEAIAGIVQQSTKHTFKHLFG